MCKSVILVLTSWCVSAETGRAEQPFGFVQSYIRHLLSVGCTFCVIQHLQTETKRFEIKLMSAGLTDIFFIHLDSLIIDGVIDHLKGSMLKQNSF